MYIYGDDIFDMFTHISHHMMQKAPFVSETAHMLLAGKSQLHSSLFLLSRV